MNRVRPPRLHSHSRRARQAAGRGFTLIELLVTVAIVGILSALAFPYFSHYRQQGVDAQVTSDTRLCANAQEAYYVDAGQYTSDLGGLQVTLSPGSQVTLSAGNSGSLTTSFTIVVSHPDMSFSSGCVWISDGVPSMSCS